MSPAPDAPQPAYFGAGPAKLPTEVLRQAQDDVLEWQGTGVGILEASHRSKEFTALMEESEAALRRLVGIPPEYAVLFMQGGGTLQFAAVVSNLVRQEDIGGCVNYLISGCWSEKAAEEAEKLLRGAAVAVHRVPIVSAPDQSQPAIPIPVGEWGLSSEPRYIYYCENETVDGIEMPSSAYVADCLQSRGVDAPLVADMSSNFLSRPIDVTRFGLIFATAQKNFGPAGVTVVVVRRDLLAGRAEELLLPLPTMMDYRLFDKHRSLYNTPPCFSLAVCGHVFAWIERCFGGDLGCLEAVNRRKAQMIYNCICESDGFYRCRVPPEYRSRMNVVFRLHTADGAASEALEETFVKEAQAAGLLQLRGHRSVGGIRVSLYNAVSVDDAMRMAAFMQHFCHQHS